MLFIKKNNLICKGFVLQDPNCRTRQVFVDKDFQFLVANRQICVSVQYC